MANPSKNPSKMWLVPEVRVGSDLPSWYSCTDVDKYGHYGFVHGQHGVITTVFQLYLRVSFPIRTLLRRYLRLNFTITTLLRRYLGKRFLK